LKKNKIILTTLSPKTHRTSEENLGIEYLKSSLLSNGYDVDIIDGWLGELEVDEIYNKIILNQEKLLFVGISSYMSNTKPTIELIQKLKKYNNDIKIVCGGFGPTFYPNDYLKNGADFIIRGEGEEAICELAKAIANNCVPINIKNIGYKENNEIVLNEMRQLLRNLDDLPFPSRDTIDIVLSKKSTVNMISSRGCSGNCDFCSVISFFRLSNGKVWRTRSIENIVDEIELLYKNGVKYIKMVDDSFVDGLRDGEWCKKFADEIEQRKIKVILRGQIRADKVSDEILYNLKRAGFFSFACGIENGSQQALSRMNKKATLEENKKALNLFKKYGYLIQMGFILFDRYTTIEELEENYEFMRKYNFTITKGIFSEMFSAEGTKLNDKLKNEGLLEETNFILNNNKYVIKDDNTRKIYDALKSWHKSHSEIYDMTIDPLIAPKAIELTIMNELYKYAMELKQIDLEVFRELLDLIKNNPNINFLNYIDQRIKQTDEIYSNISCGVQKIYKKTNLEYNAFKNPFI